jgi:hypothetical protein
VYITGITQEEFNNDVDLQNTLRTDLGNLVDASSEDVTILGSRVGENSGSRKLLQTLGQILIVDYKIEFESEAEAEIAAMELAAVESLETVEIYAQANGYSDVEVDVVDTAIEVVPATGVSSGDDGQLGIEVIAGIAAGGGLLVVVIAVFAMKKFRGNGMGKQPSGVFSGQTTQSTRDIIKASEAESTSYEMTVNIGEGLSETDDAALPSGVV